MSVEKRIACMFVVMAMVLVAIPSQMDADEQPYDIDYGRFYSYTLQFEFSGKDALTIEWDFGDGSEPSGEWNPRHTFQSEGVFYVKQTVTNTYNGGSEAVQTYKVEIMGFPVITFDTNGGSEVKPLRMGGYNMPAQKPDDPVREGAAFVCWCTDPGLSKEYDWSRNVTKSMTLYAEWGDAPSPGTGEIVHVEPKGPALDTAALIVVGCVLLCTALLVFIVRRA